MVINEMSRLEARRWLKRHFCQLELEHYLPNHRREQGVSIHCGGDGAMLVHATHVYQEWWRVWHASRATYEQHKPRPNDQRSPPVYVRGRRCRR
jgi:hypothetical protein